MDNLNDHLIIHYRMDTIQNGSIPNTAGPDYTGKIKDADVALVDDKTFGKVIRYSNPRSQTFLIGVETPMNKKSLKQLYDSGNDQLACSVWVSFDAALDPDQAVNLIISWSENGPTAWAIGYMPHQVWIHYNGADPGPAIEMKLVFQPNTWYHLTAAYNGVSVTFKITDINGTGKSASGTMVNKQPFKGDENIHIFQGLQGVSCKMAHFRLYDCALSDEEIANVRMEDISYLQEPLRIKKMRMQSDLQAYYLFDKVNAVSKTDGNKVNAVVIDSSGHGLDATLTGLLSQNDAALASRADDEDPGFFAEWFQFGKSNQVFSVNPPAEAFGMIDGQLTIDFWTRGNFPPAAAQTLMTGQDSSGQSLFEVSWAGANNGLKLTWSTGSDSVSANISNLSDRQRKDWQYWALVKDTTTGTMAIYLNAKQIAVETGKTASMAGISNFSIGQENDSNYWEGQMNRFRIWQKALSSDQLKYLKGQDMGLLPQIKEGARPTPFRFSLSDKNDQPAIYIMDDGDTAGTRLQISNVGQQPLLLKDLQSGGAKPSENNYHFELRFRQGTLKNAGAGVALDPAANGWLLSDPVPNHDSSISFFFARQGGVKIDPVKGSQAGSAAMLTIKLKNVSAEAGAEGARGTRIELRYTNVFITDNSGTKTLSGALSGSLLQYLNIVNRLGKDNTTLIPNNLPFHVGIVGSSTILNDGMAENTLLLAISNTNKAGTLNGAVKFNVSSSPASSFHLSLETGDNEWALIKQSDETVSTQVQVWKQSDKDTLKSIRQAISAGKNNQDPAWKVGDQQRQGTTIQWKITGNDKDITINPEDHILIVIANLKSLAPDGKANLYLYYNDLPGYADGCFVVPIEKSPLVNREQNVGIGTEDPFEKMHLNNGKLLLTKNLNYRSGFENIMTEDLYSELSDKRVFGKYLCVIEQKEPTNTIKIYDLSPAGGYQLVWNSAADPVTSKLDFYNIWIDGQYMFTSPDKEGNEGGINCWDISNMTKPEFLKSISIPASSYSSSYLFFKVFGNTLFFVKENIGNKKKPGDAWMVNLATFDKTQLPSEEGCYAGKLKDGTYYYYNILDHSSGDSEDTIYHIDPETYKATEQEVQTYPSGFMHLQTKGSTTYAMIGIEQSAYLCYYKINDDGLEQVSKFLTPGQLSVDGDKFFGANVVADPFERILILDVGDPEKVSVTYDSSQSEDLPIEVSAMLNEEDSYRYLYHYVNRNYLAIVYYNPAKNLGHQKLLLFDVSTPSDPIYLYPVEIDSTIGVQDESPWVRCFGNNADKLYYLNSKLNTLALKKKPEEDNTLISPDRVKTSGRFFDKTGPVMPTGAIMPFAGNEAPPGWLLCNGKTIHKTDIDFPLMADLCQVLGKTYGGDGVNTWQLPDLRSRFLVGSGQGNGLSKYSLGARDGGLETVTLTKEEMPSHTHNINHGHSVTDEGHEHDFKIYEGGTDGSYADRQGNDSGSATATTESANSNVSVDDFTESNPGPERYAGGDRAHENRPPFVAVNYIIKM